MILQLRSAGPRAWPLTLRQCGRPLLSPSRPFLGTNARFVPTAFLARDLSTIFSGGRPRQDLTCPRPVQVQARLFTPSRWRRDQDPGPQRKPSALRKVLPALPTAHENIYTLPNILTVSRLIAAPFIGYCILHDHHAWALGLFAYAGVTDLLDGWIARRWNLGTVVGTIIDPMADKMLMTVLTVALAAKGALPVWLAAIILGRDVGLGIAAIYYRWISLPPPKTFSRYWDFSLPSAEVHPTTISKYNTALQLGLMGLTTMAPVVPLEMGVPLGIMQYIVAATTVWSGASYVYSKDAVKILSKQEIDQKMEGKEKGEEEQQKQ
ncbi:hypothetical protein GQ53DRAFT_756024 [Thozetella sp. PMI_491]|nr:hypothetical protein GQ53DRAFT_756024 [Thozetella sp. PMI_491]